MPTTPLPSQFLTEVTAFAQIINALGVIGILVFLVLAFYRGDIISKPVLDRILERFWSEMNIKFDHLETKIDASANPKTTPRGW